MKHIIDPWIFYKINLVSNLKSFLMILILICIGIIIASYFTEGDEYYDETDPEKRKLVTKKHKTIKKSCVLVSIFSLIFMVFIPSEETMMKMLIADTLTVENIDDGKEYVEGNMKEFIMEIVDYIDEKVNN